MENNYGGGNKGRGRGAMHNQDLTSELRRPHMFSPNSHDNSETGAQQRPRNMTSYAAVAGGGEHRQQSQLEGSPALFNSWSSDSLSQNLASSNCPNDIPKQAVPPRNAESSIPERTKNSTIPYEITATAVNVTPGIYLESNSNFKKQSGLSPFAKEFVPRTFTPITATGVADPNFRDEITADEHVIIALNNFITDVTCNPGKYDSSVKGICSVIKLNVKSDSTLNSVVDTIFSQAIDEPNFRYNAARLCNQLNTTVQFQGLSSTFMDAVIQRTLRDFNQRDTLVIQNTTGLRGFTLFLGELYSQIEMNDERIPSLAQCIPQLLETLLNAPSLENYKSVCQVLKCTGANLEDDEKKQNAGTTPLMDKVIKQLDECIGIAPQDVQKLMKSVVELRSKNWGRRASPSPVNNYAPAVPRDPYNDMVYYGPDGLPLTEEEQLFMESNQPESDGETDDLSDEMDDEIRAAFEEFLVTTGQDQ